MGREIVKTTDGRTWSVRYRAPADLEFVDAVDAAHVCPVDRTCFDGARHGWITGVGTVFETNDGGAHWSRRVTVRDPNGSGDAGGIAGDLQCTAGGSAWVLFEGYGAAAGNSPYIGYRCSGGKCVAVVKQNYFPMTTPRSSSATLRRPRNR